MYRLYNKNKGYFKLACKFHFLRSLCIDLFKRFNSPEQKFLTMKIKKYENGYTLIEVVIAVAVAVILASSVTVSIRHFMIEKHIEKEVVSFWKELCRIRPRVLKSDTCCFVTFNIANNTYKLWKDMNDD